MSDQIEPFVPQVPAVQQTPVVQRTPAGWYPTPEGPFERWWDGARWTAHTRPLQQTPAPVAQVYVQRAPVYANPAVAVTKSRKRTSHGLHLFLTIITFGLWGLFVWLPITLWHMWGPKDKSYTHYR
jgi:hypothetical protein